MCRLLLFLLWPAAHAVAQVPSQTVRGVITDQASGAPLIGVVVAIPTAGVSVGASTDGQGHFRIPSVPAGRHTLVCRYTGYRELVLPDIVVASGKETVLALGMEEDLTTMATVEVVAERDKQEAINSMATVSARSFSVEETQKFAAAVNDPGRMATSYAGVVSPDDGGNRISIRGNSPYALLWRMEGIDIPNPNHFASSAGAGGGISILSAQTLANSDFFTGAFAAEYGNALGGVFDLRLRRGNNERREYTFQAGFLGLDAAAEGPIGRSGGGSYLVNYRYSTLSLLAGIGVPIGDAVTNFQDVSFNVVLPGERFGTFQVFGFGGWSSQTNDAERDSTQWNSDWERVEDRFYSGTGAIGLKHILRLDEESFLQTIAMASGNDYGYQADRLDDDLRSIREYEESFLTTKFTLSSVYQRKLNARHTIRTGVYYNRHGFRLELRERDAVTRIMEQKLQSDDQLSTWQAFAQWKFRPARNLTFNGGLHALVLPFNGTAAVEPRLGLRWQSGARTAFTAGYGLHSQMQPVGIYRARQVDEEGRVSFPNEDLGFNRSHHFVAGWERTLGANRYVKAEVYYQHLFQIAVGADSSSTFSTVNLAENYVSEALVSRGRGRNYGLELTLEQFTTSGFYFLLSGSLYQSRYSALDGVWRNTRYNGNYAMALTSGKEWAVGNPDKHKTLGINFRLLYTGGLRETPVDVEASRQQGRTVRDDGQTFASRNPDYLRGDLRFSIRRNRERSTSTLALDIQNVTNRRNVFGTYFDPQTGTTITAYQLPFLPLLSYRVEF